jgi:hypothetical protein
MLSFPRETVGKKERKNMANFTIYRKIKTPDTNEELALLYSHANDEERFLLDFFLGSMAHNAEAHKCKYTGGD